MPSPDEARARGGHARRTAMVGTLAARGKPWTRRSVLAGTVAAGTLALTAGRARAQLRPTVVLAPEGTVKPEDLAVYVVKYQHEPELRFAPAGRVLEALATQPDVDVAVVGDDEAVRLANTGAVPLDPADLINWRDAFDGLRRVPGLLSGRDPVVLPVAWGAYGIVVRTDLAAQVQAHLSWSALWDVRLAGRLAMPEDPRVGALVGALAAGVEPYDPSALELAQVRETLRLQRPLVRAYASDPAVLEAGLATGEMAAAVAPHTLFAALRRRSLPVAFVRPREGAVVWLEGAAVVAPPDRRERAVEVADALVGPTYGYRRLREEGLGAASRLAFQEAGAALVAELGLGPDTEALLRGAVFRTEPADPTAAHAVYREIVEGA